MDPTETRHRTPILHRTEKASPMRHLAITCLGLLLAGCSSTLETGYKPRALGAGSDERRAFYAQPFSPESQGKDRDNVDPFRARRPDAP